MDIVLKFPSQIDWQQVANQLDITNGHAARMRYSRFKQQMEGVQPTARKARTATPRQKKAKPDKSEKDKKQTEEHQVPIFKVEKEEDVDEMPGVEPTVKEEYFLKPEPVIKTELGGEEDGTWSPDGTVAFGVMQQMPLDPTALADHAYLQPYSLVEGAHQTSPEFDAVKAEAVVKMEPV